MQILVKFAGPLRSSAGVKQAQLVLSAEATGGEALARITEGYPRVGEELFGEEAKSYYSLFVNGSLVPMSERTSVRLHEGDELMVLLPVAGGGRILIGTG